MTATAAAQQHIYPGIGAFKNPHGITVLRLHHSADPEKAKGKKTMVAELGMALSPWALGEYNAMTNKALYRQEYEIDFGASLGQRLYHMTDEATLEESFPIPEDWTRYFSLDPHPAVPHAGLWSAVDRYGDLWIYRELWPSKVCFRWEDGLLVGKMGPCPEEDNRYNVRQWVAAMRWLESSENPENKLGEKSFDEYIAKRVIDYAARAFGKGTSDDPEQLNFQQRFELHMSGTCDCNPKCQAFGNPNFEDAKKDRGAGEELVNDWLLPRQVDDGRDGWRTRSRVHIFKDRCPELIYQLKNNRRQQLTALQAERMDPTGAAVAVRKHLTDNLLYICAANPVYLERRPAHSTHLPIVKGISY